MVDPRTATRWSYRMLFAAMVALIVFLRILPLSLDPQPWPLPQPVRALVPGWLRPEEWPGADLLLCLTLVWVQRRPDFIPAVLIAAIFLLDDLMAIRPPGLWALIVLLGTEFLRSRETATRDLPFWAEWMMVSGVIVAMTLAYRMVLSLLMIPQAGLGPALVYMLATIAIYPLVAGVMQVVFGLHRAAPGEVDTWGRPL